MSARTTLPLLVLALSAPAPARALAAAKPGPAAAPKAPSSRIGVRIAQLEDRRTSGSFARCTLGIELPDVPAFEVKAARVVVTKATDDLGTDLVPPGAASAKLGPTQRGSLGKPGDKTPTIVFAEVSNPPRKAKVLKRIEGEIELYAPGRDPNARALFPRLLSLAGTPLASPALRANRVLIAVLSKAQIAAERKRAADRKREELKKEGVPDSSLAESVESALDSFPKGAPGEIVLRVTDPGRVIQDLRMLDGKGEPQFASRSDQGELTVLTFWGETPTPDWSLEVLMRTEKTLLKTSFSFEDVALP